MPSLIAFVCFTILKMYLAKTCLCLFLFCLGGSTNVLCMHLQSFYTGCSVGKESACNVGDPSSIGWGRSLEKKIATHSSIFAWKIHGQRSLVGYSPWDLKESDTTLQLNHQSFYPHLILCQCSELSYLLFSLGYSSIGQYFQLIYFSNTLLLINLTFFSL